MHQAALRLTSHLIDLLTAVRLLFMNPAQTVTICDRGGIDEAALTDVIVVETVQRSPSRQAGVASVWPLALADLSAPATAGPPWSDGFANGIRATAATNR